MCGFVFLAMFCTKVHHTIEMSKYYNLSCYIKHPEWCNDIMSLLPLKLRQKLQNCFVSNTEIMWVWFLRSSTDRWEKYGHILQLLWLTFFTGWLLCVWTKIRINVDLCDNTKLGQVGRVYLVLHKNRLYLLWQHLTGSGWLIVPSVT